MSKEQKNNIIIKSSLVHYGDLTPLIEKPKKGELIVKNVEGDGTPQGRIVYIDHHEIDKDGIQSIIDDTLGEQTFKFDDEMYELLKIEYSKYDGLPPTSLKHEELFWGFYENGINEEEIKIDILSSLGMIDENRKLTFEKKGNYKDTIMDNILSNIKVCEERFLEEQKIKQQKRKNETELQKSKR